MPVDKPTEEGTWWFKGTWKDCAFEGPVEYDGEIYRPITVLGTDEIFDLEEFVGEYWPLNHEVVEHGNKELGGRIPGMLTGHRKRVVLTVDEAWQFYLATSWHRRNMERDAKEFEAGFTELFDDLFELDVARDDPDLWVTKYLTTHSREETRRTYMMVESLGSGRTSGQTNDPSFVPPERVTKLLESVIEGVKAPFIFGMLKEVFPPVFWYGEC
jgi:hypothetical protein